MHDTLAELAQHVTLRGHAHATSGVVELARPVLGVGSSMPVGQLEVIFRPAEVTCVTVHDDAGSGRVGIVTRAGITGALTGRLGYGRAVLERRPTASVTDWSPLVVRPDAPVTEVATLAMDRPGEHRYDDVLVAGATWRSASTADLMRSLVGTLAARSTHDALTGLPTRSTTWHSLARRCGLVAHGGTRVALLLLDVRGTAAINARRGLATGDVVLTEIAHRIAAAVPRGCEVGRVDGDRFAVLATLPAMDAAQAAASVESLHRDVLDQLAAPPPTLPASAWPAVDGATVWSVAGAADADELVCEAEHRLALARAR
ncbi:diguanylate cyclase [Cellulosimicrobium terreum]|nr:diguanylate cyclase [Cellulosimicrobium terreum]